MKYHRILIDIQILPFFIANPLIAAGKASAALPTGNHDAPMDFFDGSSVLPGNFEARTRNGSFGNPIPRFIDRKTIPRHRPGKIAMTTWP